MQVIKRDGHKQDVSFDKIHRRISAFCYDLEVDTVSVAQAVISKLRNNINTHELDFISADYAATYEMTHPDYGVLAKRLFVSNLHKLTPGIFSESVRKQQEYYMSEYKKYTYKYTETENYYGFNKGVYAFIMQNAGALDAMIDDERDYDFSYSALQILIANKYLICDLSMESSLSRWIDRPQYMFMRVALADGYHVKNPLQYIRRKYDALSRHYFTQATPTLLNSCLTGQLMSCFLLGTEDSLDEISRNFTNVCKISKDGGGIGIHMTNIRAKNSYIATTRGRTNGVCAQLGQYNEACKTWDQGGKRKGAFAIYMEPWHLDILEFLELKLNTTGTDDTRRRSLNYAVWMRNLLHRRFVARAQWTLFTPPQVPGLRDVYDGQLICAECNGLESLDQLEPEHLIKVVPCREPRAHERRRYDAFTMLYEYFESVYPDARRVGAYEIYAKIKTSWRDNGTPFIVNADTVNMLSNQQNIGTIHSSNLCTEIVEYSDNDSYACCTLASICLPKFVSNDDAGNTVFDFAALHDMTQFITEILNNAIDYNKYPVPECRKNSLDYRPIGIGIQGLADVFVKLGIAWDSGDALKIDCQIAETMYHAFLTASCRLARKHGRTYTGFESSPLACGKFHWELWQETNDFLRDRLPAQTCDWETLRAKIVKYGVYNSLGIAYMPTATTSFIFSNTEAFYPISSLAYVRRGLDRELDIIYTPLIRELIRDGLWTEDLKHQIDLAGGSIADIQLPASHAHLKAKYKTAWDISQKVVIERAGLRGAYIDQSQSLNLNLKSTNNNVLDSVHDYAIRCQLKTCNYYIHSRAATLGPINNIEKLKVAQNAAQESARQDDDVCPIGCETCSS